jgi:hypothetical protein
MKARLTPALLFRLAAILFVFFAAGHTVGFLRFTAPTPEGRAVYESMRDVHFTVGGQAFSYGGFYRGFGLSITAYLLFCAYVAWYLSGVATLRPQTMDGMAWALTALQLATLALSASYFSAVPTVLSALIVALIGVAAWRVPHAGGERQAVDR